jgi:hypothetical protein
VSETVTVEPEDSSEEIIEGSGSLDLRGIPTHRCICGSSLFLVPMSFEDYRPSAWLLDAECMECGNQLTVPCPADRPTGPDENGF